MKKNLLRILTLITIFLILIISISIAKTGKVNDSNVRVRSGPSTENTETITNLYLNDPVEVIEQVGEWYKVELKDGKTGYIFADFVNVTGAVPSADPTEEKVDTSEKPKTETLEEEKEEVVEKVFPTQKIKTKISGKHMPLLYSEEKIVFKKNEVLKILDEKAFWSKVSNDKTEAWILTKDLTI